jgi:hypothetical protein
MFERYLYLQTVGVKGIFCHPNGRNEVYSPLVSAVIGFNKENAPNWFKLYLPYNSNFINGLYKSKISI